MVVGTKSGGEAEKQAARGFVLLMRSLSYQNCLSLALQTHQLLSLSLLLNCLFLPCETTQYPFELIYY